MVAPARVKSGHDLDPIKEEIWQRPLTPRRSRRRSRTCVATAHRPDGKYHFEFGRKLGTRLGYSVKILDQVPEGAIESFAGVGYFFDLAELPEGKSVVDLGCGSGMDVFFTAHEVGSTGRVVGVDFTVEQLDKARRLATEASISQVELREGHIDALPIEDESVECVISNGVICDADL